MDHSSPLAAQLMQIFSASPEVRITTNGYHMGSALSLVQQGQKIYLVMRFPTALENVAQYFYGSMVLTSARAALQQPGGALGELHKLLGSSRAAAVTHYGDGVSLFEKMPLTGSGIICQHIPMQTSYNPNLSSYCQIIAK
jgi:hypothetical protein